MLSELLSIQTTFPRVPIIRYLGFWVRVIIVQVLGKYMIIWYLDPSGFGVRSNMPSSWDLEDVEASTLDGGSLAPLNQDLLAM